MNRREFNELVRSDYYDAISSMWKELYDSKISSEDDFRTNHMNKHLQQMISFVEDGETTLPKLIQAMYRQRDVQISHVNSNRRLGGYHSRLNETKKVCRMFGILTVELINYFE